MAALGAVVASVQAEKQLACLLFVLSASGVAVMANRASLFIALAKAAARTGCRAGWHHGCSTEHVAAVRCLNVI